jgi:hypothetical protein
MPTNRRPFSRSRQPPFPPEAVEVFKRMVALEKLDDDAWPPRAHLDEWCALHSRLHDLLGLRPWQWWGVQPPDVVYPKEDNADAQARYVALAEAAGIELE